MKPNFCSSAVHPDESEAACFGELIKFGKEKQTANAKQLVQDNWCKHNTNK